MNKYPDDLDFATTASFDYMTIFFQLEGICIKNSIQCKEHSTNRIIIGLKTFEITSLRTDKHINDQLSSVSFTDNWMLDASRRDLTINAMSIDTKTGEVYDYFNGYDDLLKHKISFIGCPKERIIDDPRVILRYFRFFQRYASPVDNHESRILTAIRKNKHYMTQVEGKRIWHELKRIWESKNYIVEIMELMYRLGLNKYLGFNNRIRSIKVTKRLCDLKIPCSPATFLSAFVKTYADAKKISEFYQMSKDESDLMKYIVSNKPYSCKKEQLKKIYDKADKRHKHFIQELIKYSGNWKGFENIF